MMEQGKTWEWRVGETKRGNHARITFTETFDKATNKSIITISKLEGMGVSYYGSSYYLRGRISVDGTPIVSFDDDYYFYWDKLNTFNEVYDQNKKQGHTWSSGEITHDSDGSKAVTITIDISGNTDGGSASTRWYITESKTVELTNIDLGQAYIMGSAFETFAIHIYDGNDWGENAPYIPYIFENGTWVQYGGSGDSVATYDPVFANNTWEQIADACRTRRVPDTWLVADQKTMTIDGTDYLIDIIGKDHDDYADGSGKAPLTFQLHDCYTVKYSMSDDGNNSLGWENCKIRKTALPNILSLLPTVIQNAIKEVNKITSTGGYAGNLTSTADKLFLLSEVEIRNSEEFTLTGEGEQYDYYLSVNNLKKKVNNTYSSWWTRSPRVGVYTHYRVINSDGDPVNSSGSSSHGVSFAFCF